MNHVLRRARLFQSPSLRGSGRFPTARRSRDARRGSFNPLHCGAVVASEAERRCAKVGAEFQSPSLRGSGRFARAREARDRGSSCFNPLHCGAVVASGVRLALAWGVRVFQSPSLRGSGRFWSSPKRCSAAARAVSIPFIAGQWSLPRAARIGQDLAESRFNPLHCGAVVASRASARGARAAPSVSIPFIAGQWSLLSGAAPKATRSWRRLNPLHCGAVVASSWTIC